MRPGTETIRWLAGDPAVQRAVGEALARPGVEAEALHASPWRRVDRLLLDDPIARAVVVKRSLVRGSPLERWAERARRRIHRSADAREWRALGLARAAGLPVPEPLAWGRTDRGEGLLVSAALDGEPMGEALGMPEPGARAARVAALVDAVDRFHAAGFAHGDLHLGNLRWTDAGTSLLDLQRATPRASRRQQALDRARLEFSIERAGLPEDVPAALRRAWPPSALEDDARRRFLADHQRGRARRGHRAERDWQPIRVGLRRGLRDRTIEEAEIVAALAAVEAGDGDGRGEARRDESTTAAGARRGGRATVRRTRTPGGRALVVKRVAAGSPARALADRVRGCAAARAFRMGQRHRLVGDHAARPLAWLARHRVGLPVESWLVLEPVGEHDLDAYHPDTPSAARRLARALGAWLAERHARGLAHADLKGGNLRLTPARGGAPARFWLVDLEDLLPPGPVTEKARLRALAQLNASLADEAFDAGARRAALEAYADRLPFARPLADVEHEIARRSLERRHRWRGEGCAKPAGVSCSSP